MNLDSEPDCILLHHITNNVHDYSASDCGNYLNNMISSIAQKHKSIKVFISLGLPCIDDLEISIKVETVNTIPG